MKEFKDKNYKLIMCISVACLVLIIFASSYAYFKTKIINNTNPFSVKVGKVDLLIDTNQITIENAAPILDEDKNEKAVTKTFTIKRTADSNLDICYNLYLVIDQITDNIKNSKYLKYELTDKKSGEVISKNLSTVVYSEGKSTILLKNQYLSDSDTTGVEYELKVWLSYDEVEDQMSLLGGSLTAHLYVSGMQGTTCPASVETIPTPTPTLKDKLLADNPTIGTRTDFSTPFKTNTVNTLYKSTENGTDVYYFSGVDFIEAYCEYNGKIIKNYSVNSKLTKEKCLSSLTLCEINNKLYYGHYDCSGRNGTTITTTQGKWVENVEKPINNWVKFGKNSSNKDLYWRIIRTNADGSIRLLYHGTSTTATDAYIGKSAINENYNDPMYVGYMYGTSGSQESNRTNTNNSTIKTAIDDWYESNMTSYTKYLSTTAVYCNDREVGRGTYSATGSEFDYAAFTRLLTNKTPTYDCTNNNDKFTVDASTGNGKLTYPIALMTADEIAYAGGVYSTRAPMWYYTNSSFESSIGTELWWLLSPFSWGDNKAWGLYVTGSDSPGDFDNTSVYYSRGVRPVVSLKSCTLYSTGNWTSETPYEIVETSSGC